MKLLFDANLSPVLVDRLADLFPASKHVFDLGHLVSDDIAIWAYAKDHEFVIATKDSDFHNFSFLYHAPPKEIWLRIGKAPTRKIEGLCAIIWRIFCLFTADLPPENRST